MYELTFSALFKSAKIPQMIQACTLSINNEIFLVSEFNLILSKRLFLASKNVLAFSFQVPKFS